MFLVADVLTFHDQREDGVWSRTPRVHRSGAKMTTPLALLVMWSKMKGNGRNIRRRRNWVRGCKGGGRCYSFLGVNFLYFTFVCRPLWISFISVHFCSFSVHFCSFLYIFCCVNKHSWRVLYECLNFEVKISPLFFDSFLSGLLEIFKEKICQFNSSIPVPPVVVSVRFTHNLDLEAMSARGFWPQDMPDVEIGNFFWGSHELHFLS